MSEEKTLSISDWINKLSGPEANPGTCSDYERAKAELSRIHFTNVIAAMDKLNKSVIESSSANNNLANKVFWLNVALVVATSVMAITAVVTLFNR